MTVNACAEIVRQGDPDRFLAAMAAAPRTRGVLFPVYALNVEAARAPWVTEEPMIAEIRLQFWRDVLDEIAAGKPVRRHEVAGPLSEAIDAEGARILDLAVAARRWEIAREPFAGMAQLRGHLWDLAGGLMWAAARSLGASDEAAVRGTGYAGGLAGWLVAVPELAARGLAPLPDDSDAGIRALAEEGLDHLSPVSRAARPAALAAWEAGPVLTSARRSPALVRQGGLERAPFARRARLIRMALL